MKKSLHNKRLLKDQFSRLLFLVLGKFSTDNDIINLKITIETEDEYEQKQIIEWTHKDANLVYVAR